MTDYYSIRFLEKEIKKNNSIIYRSLFKHGYSSFSLEIIEYCDKSEIIPREQYYIDQLKPEYNILLTAGSSLGFKHSLETIAKFKGRKHSDETKAKMREKALTPERFEHLKNLNANPEFKAKRLEHLKRFNSSNEHQEHLKRLHRSLKGRPRAEGAGSPSISVEVFDTENNVTTVFPSISEAAQATGVTKANIYNAFKRLKENAHCPQGRPII